MEDRGQQGDDPVKDKIRSLAKRASDIDKDSKELRASVLDLEARVRVLESTDMGRLRQDLYKLESRIQSFESDHDDRKENWKVIVNFVAQLIWVCMAAWLLMKLGLQAPI